MSYRGIGDATTAGEIPNAWTQRKAAEFNAAMARYGSSGVGAIAPMFRVGRPIAIPNPRLPGLDISRGLDTSRKRGLDTHGLDTLQKPFGTSDDPAAEPPPVGPVPVGLMIGWGAAVVVAAGIFWAVTRPGSFATATATANKRRRSRRRSGRLRQNRRRLRRNGEIVVRYGQSVDHRTPFFEHWYLDGSRSTLESTSDVATAKAEADRMVAALKKQGFSARARKESLGWTMNSRRRRRRRTR